MTENYTSKFDRKDSVKPRLITSGNTVNLMTLYPMPHCSASDIIHFVSSTEVALRRCMWLAFTSNPFRETAIVSDDRLWLFNVFTYEFLYRVLKWATSNYCQHIIYDYQSYFIQYLAVTTNSQTANNKPVFLVTLRLMAFTTNSFDIYRLNCFRTQCSFIFVPLSY